ncbi:unnamed protein product [Cuscuta campestris]|uniref:Zinc/iron permease n=1 Tax=Cuscuta campestris TaxID=132261 RepID=A0A484KDE7_9ASTE|nr:unnamed protein product [Cuscuta campestris]
MAVIPSFVLGDSTCGGGDDSGEDAAGHDKKQALKYKLAAVASILVAGGLGVSLPVLGRRVRCMSPDASFFFFVKAFAAGVILATGFIHVLPDAFENLTSPCLGEKPWVSSRSAGSSPCLPPWGLSWWIALPRLISPRDAPATGRCRVFLFPSSSLTPCRISGFRALTFHQFFEGMGLGGCIAQAELKSKATAVMIAFFSLTTPVGIGIGIGISNVYDENSQKALITEGVFNSASAGILIYMALVDLLAADFMDPRMRRNMKLQFGANVSLLLGAGLMSLLAKWA